MIEMVILLLQATEVHIFFLVIKNTFKVFCLSLGEYMDAAYIFAFYSNVFRCGYLLNDSILFYENSF